MEMAKNKNRYHGEVEQLQTKLQSLRSGHRKLQAESLDDPDLILISALDLELEEEELHPLIEETGIKASLLAEYEDNERRRFLALAVEQENNLQPGTLTRGVVGSVTSAVTESQTGPGHPEPKGEPVSAHWQKYRAEKLGNGDWKSKRIARGYDVKFNTFIKLVGDLRTTELTKQICIEYKDGLMGYLQSTQVDNSEKNNADQKLGGAEQQAVPSLDVATRNNHMIAIRGFFNWLVVEDKLQSNPLSPKLIPKRDARKEKRDPFSVDDLALLFSQPRFCGRYKHNWQFWIPLLGLHTGARIEELAQLRGVDIVSIPDVPGALFLDICDRDDFSGKTASAVRKIPIHAKLIELGFLDFVKANGKEHLFPAPATSDGKRGSKMSNDFSRLKTKLGFGEKKVFHSFRNTFVDRLRRAGSHQLITAALIGHAQIGEANERYGTPHEEELDHAVQKVNFDDVLSKVERWKENRL